MVVVQQGHAIIMAYAQVIDGTSGANLLLAVQETTCQPAEPAVTSSLFRRGVAPTRSATFRREPAATHFACRTTVLQHSQEISRF